MERPKKKKVDYQALGSPFMRIPRMDVATARDLLDIGLAEIYHLQGRSPESLFNDLQRLKPEAPADRLAMIRMAVYFAETPDPNPQLLQPSVWRNP